MNTNEVMIRLELFGDITVFYKANTILNYYAFFWIMMQALKTLAFIQKHTDIVLFRVFRGIKIIYIISLLISTVKL